MYMIAACETYFSNIYKLDFERKNILNYSGDSDFRAQFVRKNKR